MRKRGIVLAGVLAAGFALRRVGSRSGVRDAENDARLEGDELVAQPLWQSTRGITIDRPPKHVWPWLVQMGFPLYRAGWYTPRWFDRLVWRIEARSADEIRSELQQLAVGDRVPDSRDWSVFFTVAALEPERALVLHSTRHLVKPIRTVDFSWAFVLHAVPPAQTRLLIRARASYTPRWARPVGALVLGPADWINAGAMLRGIKSRAERTSGRDGRRSVSPVAASVSSSHGSS